MAAGAGGNIIREVFTRLGVQTDPLALKRFEEAVATTKEKMGQASTAAAGFTANLRSLADSAFGLAKEGANVQQIATAFEALGGTAAELQKLREQTGGLVSDSVLQRAMNLGKLFKLPAEEIPALLKIAQGASVALGTSVEKNIEDVFVAMARQSKLIADNLGTQMGSLDEINQSYAERNKLNAKNLTDEQKSLAFIQTFIAKSQKQADLADKAAENTFALLEAQVTNVTDRVKLLLNRVLGGAIQRLGQQFGPIMKRMLDGFDRFWGEAKNVEKAIKGVEVAVKLVGVGIAGIIGAKVFLGLAQLVQWAVAFGRALVTAGQAAFSLNAKLLIIPAVLGSLVLLVEDIMVWLRGGDSLIGRFIKKFENAPGPMGKVARFLRDAKPMIQAVGSAISSAVSTSVKWLKGTLWPIVQQVGQTAWKWISKALGFLSAEGPGAVGMVVTFAQTAWEWIGKIVGAIVAGAQTAWEWIKAGSAVVASVAVVIYDAVAGVLADIWQAIRPWVGAIIQLLEGIWSWVKAIGGPIIDGIVFAASGIWELIKSIGGFIATNIGPALSVVWEAVRVIWNGGLAIVEWLGTAAALIATGVNWFMQTVAPFVEAFFAGIITTAGVVIGLLAEWAAYLVDLITPAIEVILGVVALIFQGVADGFAAARKGWDAFWGWIKGGLDTMTTAFGAAFGALGQVITGIFDTVMTFIQPVVDLIDATLGKALKAAQVLGLADEAPDPAATAEAQRLSELGGGGIGGYMRGIQTEVAAQYSQPTAGAKTQNIDQIQVNVTAPSSDPVAVGAATKDATQQALAEAGRDLAVGE